MMRSWRLLVVLTRLVARPWSERAALLYATVAVVAGILFGGNAMHPRDLTALAGRHPLFGAALWVIWIVAAAPAARALLVVPSGFALRALPVPRWQLAAIPMAHLVIAEAPWALLWGIGEGALAGLAFAVGAAAAHALVVARVRRPIEVAAAVVLPLVFLARVPHPARLAAALAACAVAGEAAWRRAPEAGISTGRGWVRGAPWVASARALLASAARAESAVLVRGGGLLLLGAGCALLGARNNHVVAPSSLVTVTLAVGAMPLGAALSAVGGALLRAERRTSWVLSACGATPALRVTAAGAAGALVGLVGGAVHAAFVMVGLGLGLGLGGRMLAAGALLGAALGWSAASLARLVGDGPAASDRALGGTLALVIFASIATGLGGETGLLPVMATAIGLGGAALAAANAAARPARLAHASPVTGGGT